MPRAAEKTRYLLLFSLLPFSSIIIDLEGVSSCSSLHLLPTHTKINMRLLSRKASCNSRARVSCGAPQQGAVHRVGHPSQDERPANKACKKINCAYTWRAWFGCGAPRAPRRILSLDSHGQNSFYFLGWQEYEKNSYDPITNPTGIIQMGLAENQVSTIKHHTTLPISQVGS